MLHTKTPALSIDAPKAILLAKARAGAEVVIENGALPAAILRSGLPTRRTVSELPLKTWLSGSQP